MKYLKLYEAFDANVLNSLNNFLKSKVSKESMKKFTNDLEKLGKFFDFRINELSKDDIEYLKYDDALKVKGDDENLYCVKYWFSADKGYIGYTGTSNKMLKPSDGRLEIIPKDHLDKLSKEYNVSGELVKCEISEFVTGDYVVLYCDGYDFDYSELVVARIFRQENGYVFAIQNKKPGGTPSGNTWQQYGNYSWSLGTTRSPSRDNACLRKLVLDDKVDGIIYQKEENNEDLDISDYFLYNLPLNSNFEQEPWIEINPDDDYYDENDEGYYDEDDNWVSINGKTPSIKDNIKNQANYSIIIYLNRLSNKGKVRPLIAKRSEEKVDAIALLDNETFKKANIDRYITKLFDKFNIKSSGDMSNLNQFIITLVEGRNFLVDYLMVGASAINPLSNSISYIFEIISGGADTEPYYNALKQAYFAKRKEMINFKKLDVSRSGDVIKEIYEIYLSIGDMLVDHLKKNEISNAYELKGLYYKINTIFSMHNDGRLYDPNVGRFFRSDMVRGLEFTNGLDSVQKAKNMRMAASAILR